MVELRKIDMVECVFCRIIDGQIPSYMVFEDNKHAAFLDINPCTKGHTVVIPKKHEDYLFNMTPDELAEFFKFAQKIAKGLDKALKPVRTCVVVEGFAVPHAHIHLHPCYSHSLEFKPISKPDEKDFKETAEEIKRCIK